MLCVHGNEAIVISPNLDLLLIVYKFKLGNIFEITLQLIEDIGTEVVELVLANLTLSYRHTFMPLGSQLVLTKTVFEHIDSLLEKFPLVY